MIGYVLLVGLAISLSAIVFIYLKLYLPSEKPQCYDDVELSIDEVVCESATPSGNAVRVTLTNRGLFSIDGAYIRVGEVGRLNKTLVNNPNTDRLFPCNGVGIELKPGETYCESFGYSGSTGEIEVNVEPFVFIENKPVLCSKGIVSKTFDCSP